MRDVIYDRIRISPDSKPVFQQKATDFMSLTTAAAIFALVLPFPEKSLKSRVPTRSNQPNQRFLVSAIVSMGIRPKLISLLPPAFLIPSPDGNITSITFQPKETTIKRGISTVNIRLGSEIRFGDSIVNESPRPREKLTRGRNRFGNAATFVRRPMESHFSPSIPFYRKRQIN